MTIYVGKEKTTYGSSQDIECYWIYNDYVAIGCGNVNPRDPEAESFDWIADFSKRAYADPKAMSEKISVNRMRNDYKVVDVASSEVEDINKAIDEVVAQAMMLRILE